MNEDIIFKRRNRLKKHFVNTSNVLLYCYESVSDAAKTSFQVIDSFDWEDKETGDSKGYVYPAVEKLALFRHTSDRTIRRHIKELEDAKLLTRIRRRNKPSILYIEDVATEEIDKYFTLIGKNESNSANRTQSIENGPQEGIHFNSQEELQAYITKAMGDKQQPRNDEKTDNPIQSRTDKNVRSESLRERTKMSVAYMYEIHEKKENEINVNEHFKTPSNGLHAIKNILSHYAQNSKSIPSPKPRKQKLKSDDITKRDYLAQEAADTLGDQKSLGAFRRIAELVPEHIIRDCLANIKETWKDGKIKKSRGALFMDIIKTYCEKNKINLGFKYSGT